MFQHLSMKMAHWIGYAFLSLIANLYLEDYLILMVVFFLLISDGQTAKCTQRYYENTNVLCTEMTNSDMHSYRIIDFCPRFEQHGRMFRPLTIIRIVEPIRGNSSIQVMVRISGWDKKPAVQSRGNSHINYAIQENFLRVTTNMSLTYLENQTPLFFKRKIILLFELELICR